MTFSSKPEPPSLPATPSQSTGSTAPPWICSILDWAKDYSNAKSLIDKLTDTYAGLAEETGFVAYQL